jgi:hypothetical protein
MEPRLKSGIWVAAYLRRRAAHGVPGFVVRHGDETSGTVLVKINLLDGRARIFAAGYNEHGERVWSPALGEDPAEEADVAAYIERAVGRDPDVWVIEIEDKAGEADLEGM